MNAIAPADYLAPDVPDALPWHDVPHHVLGPHDGLPDLMRNQGQSMPPDR